jgi:putative DNA primase/helicase
MWMLEGCRQWLEKGLDPPACVLAATDDYVTSADAVMRWIDERCLLGPVESMTKAQAFASWKHWAERAGEHIGSAQWLRDRLIRLPKVDEARIGKERTRTYLGIGLRYVEADEADRAK